MSRICIRDMEKLAARVLAVYALMIGTVWLMMFLIGAKGLLRVSTLMGRELVQYYTAFSVSIAMIDLSLSDLMISLCERGLTS